MVVVVKKWVDFLGCLHFAAVEKINTGHQPMMVQTSEQTSECGCVTTSEYVELQEGVVVVRERRVTRACENHHHANNCGGGGGGGLKKCDYVVLRNIAADLERMKKRIAVHVGGTEYSLDTTHFHDDRLVVYASLQ